MVNMKLQYQDKVPLSYRDEFVKKVQSISSNLNIDPNWLMAIMFWESAGTFSPSVQNKTSGATGLIQFMPSTAVGLGTSTTELKITFSEPLSDNISKDNFLNSGSK